MCGGLGEKNTLLVSLSDCGVSVVHGLVDRGWMGKLVEVGLETPIVRSVCLGVLRPTTLDV